MSVVTALGFSPGSFADEAHGSVTETMDGKACKGESPMGHAWIGCDQSAGRLRRLQVNMDQESNARAAYRHRISIP
jgi:nicotinamide mononucleotide (NMN) deamidase PncC